MFIEAIKKAISLILPFLMLFSQVNPGEASVTGIRLTLNGKDVTASCSPVIENGRTLVPIRFISESLGATVTWDNDERSVTVIKGDRSAFLRIGSYLAVYNDGALYQLSDVAPKIINNLTYVPLRLLGNALGIGIDWDDGSRTVVVDSNKISDITPFFEVKFNSLRSGDTITGDTVIRLSIPANLKERAKELKLLLLSEDTAKGFVVAGTKEISSEIRYLPKIEDKGEKLLVAALYDSDGVFIGGDTVKVTIDVKPQVSLTGIKDSDIIKENAKIGQTLNFLAPYVEYEFTNKDTGKVTVIEKQDPQGIYTWTPTVEQNGSYTVKATAFDGNGNRYESGVVSVRADVTKRISLTGVTPGQTINKPVTLLASRNFDVSETQYVCRDLAKGTKTVIATIPYGSYNFFPGPEFSGEKELSVRVKDVRGNTIESSAIKVKIDGSPKVLLKGIAPGQVVSDKTTLSVISNVKLDGVNYILSGLAGGKTRTLTSDSNQQVVFTPSGDDPSEMSVLAQGSYQGMTVKSESVSFKIYTGTLYGPRPIIEKDRFLSLASELAKDSSNKTGMSTALQTAQAILETGWGQSVPVDKYSGKFSNNLFGIKGTGPNGSVISNTWEVYNGITYRVDAAFRAYENVEQSWEDRNSLLLTASRYAPFREVMYDSTLGAWAVKRSGYATDPLYPIKLINIINQYNLLELDKTGI